MRQYLNLLREVYENGEWKEPARTNLPRTKEIFCSTMTFDLSEGFPLITTKKMFIKGFVAELLWFLKGSTNIKELVDQGVHIWDDDAYRYYKMRGGGLPKEPWLDMVKAGTWSRDTRADFGDLGKVYGYQWRCFRGMYDQIKRLITNIKLRPNSRYHLVTAWDPTEFFEFQSAALPTCHILFQCSVTNGRLDLMMLQRSCDMVLGVPFDIAEYALLCHMIAAECDLKPGIFTWVGNSIHIYENHLDQVKELLSREPYELCTLKLNKRNSIFGYTLADIKFENYKCHPAIKAKLNTGL